MKRIPILALILCVCFVSVSWSQLAAGKGEFHRRDMMRWNPHEKVLNVDSVNGTGFISGSALHWNGSPSATHLISDSRLIAAMLTPDITTADIASAKHFRHVLVLVQENRTPDNLFHALCGPQLILCPSPYDLQSFGFNSTGKKVLLKKSRLGSHNDPLHDHPDFVALCDFDPQTQQCKMDGADKIPCHSESAKGNQPGGGLSTAQSRNAPNCSFEYVDPSDIQPYLTLVQQYGYANYMFSTSQGGSFPGHQFLFSGTSAPSAADDEAGFFSDKHMPWHAEVGCFAEKTTYVTLITPNGYRKAKPCFEHNTIPDILPSNVSWRYYASARRAGMWVAPNAIKHICQPDKRYGGKCVGPEWVNNVDFSSRDVFTDIANCNLRSLSWVIPSGENSDHPGGKPANGPSWIASIVNAIGTNTTCDKTGYWEDTAIIVTWDDFGGFYDHVPPPILPMPQGDFQLGPRVPLLFVSAYTPINYIDNNQQDYGSILRFVEQNWGIQEGALNFADARATNDLTTFFNLNQQPRAFVPIPAPKDANYFLNDKTPPTDPDDD